MSWILTWIMQYNTEKSVNPDARFILLCNIAKLQNSTHIILKKTTCSNIQSPIVSFNKIPGHFN